jgi:hypothetical protein
MSSEAQPDATIVGYCRACGKPLDAANVRTAHGTLYCEEHVPMESTAPGSSSPYTTTAPPPMPDTGVSPGVAFVLGLIPGVGACYNGQYAKGLAHAFILGMLFWIVDNDSGSLTPILSVMIPGFFAYMAFEAYHTAKQRRRGGPVDEFSSLIPSRNNSRFPVIPVLLIAFGTVFLLSNLEIFDLHKMIRFWPVMMIGLGVYLLYLRLAGGSEVNRDR